MEPVNLENLRSMTDGDAELEKELFNEFYRSFETSLTALQEGIDTADNEKWRKEAHALKGISFNLGADALGELCKTAQDQHNADVTTKKTMLQGMQSEYTRVKDFLTQL